MKYCIEVLQDLIKSFKQAAINTAQLRIYGDGVDDGIEINELKKKK